MLPVAGGRRQVRMVQLVMMGVRGDGAAAKDILDEERRPAGGSSVLAWLSLLLLAGRLHLFSLRLRRVRLHLAVLARRQGREIGRGTSPTPWRPPSPVLRPGVPRTTASACLRCREDLAGELTLETGHSFPVVRRVGDRSRLSANRTSLEVHPPTESRLIAADLAHGSAMNRAGRRLSLTVFHRRSPSRRLGRVSVSAARFRAIQPPQRDHRQPLPLVSVPRRPAPPWKGDASIQVYPRPAWRPHWPASRRSPSPGLAPRGFQGRDSITRFHGHPLGYSRTQRRTEEAVAAPTMVVVLEQQEDREEEGDTRGMDPSVFAILLHSVALLHVDNNATCKHVYVRVRYENPRHPRRSRPLYVRDARRFPVASI